MEALSIFETQNENEDLESQDEDEDLDSGKEDSVEEGEGEHVAEVEENGPEVVVAEDEEEEKNREGGGRADTADDSTSTRGRKRSLSESDAEAAGSNITKKKVTPFVKNIKKRLTRFSKRDSLSHKVEEIVANLNWQLSSEALKVKILLL